MATRWLVDRARRVVTLRYWRGRFEDLAFDYRNGVDTRAVYLAELHIESNHLDHATNSVPTSERSFRAVMSHVPADPRRFLFIDVGSGKGRILFCAARLGFLRIVGVEFAAQLHQVAVENIRRFNLRSPGAHIESRCMDATQLDLPPEPTVLFLYNPFDAVVMQKFVGLIEKSLRSSPRELYIAYLEPRCDTLLEQTSCLEKTHSGGWFSIHRSRALS
jgi:hypothetical protein